MNRMFNAKPWHLHGVQSRLRNTTELTSGASRRQLGVSADGTLAGGANRRNWWTNIRNVLAEVGMELTGIIKMTHYLLRKEDFPGYREVRSKFLGDHQPRHAFVHCRAWTGRWLVGGGHCGKECFLATSGIEIIR